VASAVDGGFELVNPLELVGNAGEVELSAGDDAAAATEAVVVFANKLNAASEIDSMLPGFSILRLLVTALP